MTPRPWAIGDIVRPATGGAYRGRIVHITDDHVSHACLVSGTVSTKSRFGFFCRYELEEEEGEGAP